MSSSTTRYITFVNDVPLETEKPVTKRPLAIENARKIRKDEVANVRVETSNGKVVFELKAPKKIKMSKPFTRLVAVPEGVELPEGDWRPAYDRSRKNLFILHNSETGEYAVFDFKAQVFLAEGLETTREAGAFCKTVPAPAKA